jgi:hypothetical protein
MVLQIMEKPHTQKTPQSQAFWIKDPIHVQQQQQPVNKLGAGET